MDGCTTGYTLGFYWFFLVDVVFIVRLTGLCPLWTWVGCRRGSWCSRIRTAGWSCLARSTRSPWWLRSSRRCSPTACSTQRGQTCVYDTKSNLYTCFTVCLINISIDWWLMLTEQGWSRFCRNKHDAISSQTAHPTTEMAFVLLLTNWKGWKPFRKVVY